MEHLESVYTSTNRKLMRHCEELRWIGPGECVWKPITLHVSPTDQCNLNCEFCSVRDRAGDELDFDKLRKCITDFETLGVYSIEITGGGDPTLYPNIRELINFITRVRTTGSFHAEQTSVGLITNGLALNRIPLSTLNKLAWLRISLSAVDRAQTAASFLPSISNAIEYATRISPKVTIGFSYVIHEKTTSTTARDIQHLIDVARPTYLRLVPDCLTGKSMRRAKIKAYKWFGDLIADGKAFFQTKDARVPEKCYIGYLKPFLNSDGWVYMCSTCPLFARKFPEEWRLCRMEDVWDYWHEFGAADNKGFDTSNCTKCFYADQNDLLADLRTEIPHEEFI